MGSYLVVVLVERLACFAAGVLAGKMAVGMVSWKAVW